MQKSVKMTKSKTARWPFFKINGLKPTQHNESNLSLEKHLSSSLMKTSDFNLNEFEDFF